MATKKKPPLAVLQRTDAVLRKHGGNQVRAASELKIARSTLQNHVRWFAAGESEETDLAKVPTREQYIVRLVEMLRENAELTEREWRAHCRMLQPERFGNLFGGWSQFKAEGMKVAGIGAEQLSERERRRFKDEIERLRRELDKVHREENASEDVRAAFFGLSNQPVTPPDWTLDVRAAQGTPGIPLLFFSDAQWGERISARELDGVNEFNLEVAHRRYRKMIERTVDLCYSHMVSPRYPGIYYLRGGDMISGDIHQELRETNDAQSIPAVLDLTAHEKWGISVLAERFGRVHVVSVPGNHGRTTIKPMSKRYSETNYDYLAACMLEREFAGDKRVTFRTPLSGDAIFRVFGYTWALTHGDRIGSRGGQGFIGPAATIARGMKKVADSYAALGVLIDYQLVGHFHTSLELEYGWSNGSLPGYSEYARDFRALPKPPSQWLLFCHPKYGVTCRWPILLEPKPRRESVDTEAFGDARAAA